MKAFETVTVPMGIVSIVFAETASKARYTTYLSANDAGYKITFPDITVRRASQYDCRRTTDGNIPAGRMCHRAEFLATEKPE